MNKETEKYLRELSTEIVQWIPEVGYECAYGFYMHLVEEKLHMDFIKDILPLMTVEDTPGKEYTWDLSR